MFGFSKDLEGKRYLTRGLVAARYRRNARTIRRWQEDPAVAFPAPDLLINGKAYWENATLDAFDERLRALAGKEAA